MTTRRVALGSLVTAAVPSPLVACSGSDDDALDLGTRPAGDDVPSASTEATPTASRRATLAPRPDIEVVVDVDAREVLRSARSSSVCRAR